MKSQSAIRDSVYRASQASLFIYSASAILLPVSLVTISEELGFTLTQGGSLGFLTSIEQFFVLIASSFAAARFGKIRVLRAGLLTLAAGLLLFVLSGSWLAAMAFMLVIGLGNGLLEALLTPIVEDLYPNDNGSKMNLLHAFWPVGTCVAVLLFGQLLSIGVAWRFLFAGTAAAVILIAALFPSSRKISLPKSKTDFSHMKEILSMPRFWALGGALAFSGGAEAAYAFWSASYIQLHYAALPSAGALGTALFAVGMAVGRFASSKIAGYLGLKKLIVISTLFGAAASLSFFLITSLWALFIFLFIMGLSVACLWPSIQSYAGSELKVDPTLLMIFLSCFGLPGFSSATLIMGMIGDTWSLQASFIIAPLYLLLACSLVLVRRRRRT